MSLYDSTRFLSLFKSTNRRNRRKGRHRHSHNHDSPGEVLTYTGCYCEENVWKLFAHDGMKPFLEEGFAVFISNSGTVRGRSCSVCNTYAHVALRKSCAIAFTTGLHS